MRCLAQCLSYTVTIKLFRIVLEADECKVVSYGLSVKCTSQPLMFEYMVPSWWHCFGSCGILKGWSLAGGREVVCHGEGEGLPGGGS